MDLRVWRISSLLHRAGVRPGDVVAHAFARESTQLTALLATARIGATVFSIPLNTPAARRGEMLGKVGATFLATDLAGLEYPHLQPIRITPEAGGPIEQPIAHEIKDARPDAPWIIVSGSGSTGKSKLMAITHRQQRARMAVALELLPYSERDVLASLAHMDFHVAKLRYLEAFAKGAAIALADHGPLNLIDPGRQDKVTAIYGTVFHVEQLLKAIAPGTRGHLEPLTALMISGSAVSIGLRERIRDGLCSRLYVMYGTNECHTVCMTRPTEVFGVPGNVGRPHGGSELQVVDGDDIALPAGRVGHVRVRSASVIDGYLDDEIATARAFRNGWFYPGDLGRMTGDGQLIHMGRSDDLMIMNGINIYPSEIDQTLLSHPAVEDAVTFPLKHAVHQDVPVSAVKLVEGSSVSKQQLRAFARDRLGAHSPHRIVVLDAIPRNDQGKVIRADLLERVRKHLEPRRGDGDATGSAIASIARPPAGRQLSRQMRFAFRLDKIAQSPELDAWLPRVLEEDAGTDCAAAFHGHENVPPMARQWLSSCLRLSRQALQAAGVPVFDAPRVLACAPAASGDATWNVVVAFARVDGLPIEAYVLVVNACFALLGWASRRAPDADRLKMFLGTMQRRAVAPVSAMFTVGKSTFPILKAAHRRGIPFRHLGEGVYQLGWGAKSRRMDRSATDMDSAIGLKMAQRKALTARMLHAAGLPGAVHEQVDTVDAARGAARRLGWPVVVKPVDKDRGEGVTVDVADDEGLRTAFDEALRSSRAKQVLVEQQVAGVCHRLLVANGKLLYAVKRLPMSVIGNGRQTVAELVADEFEAQQRLPPWKRSEIRPLDAAALAAMAAVGISESSVPADGVLVPLRRIESIESGGVDEEVTGRIHAENRRVALAAAALLGLDMAGVDIISQDISRPWHENGAIINEVNFAPLFGVGKISREYVQAFVEDFIDGDGRIPVEVFVGGDAAWQAAMQRWKAWLAEGKAAYLTNEVRTLTAGGDELRMSCSGNFSRARALALSTKVGAMVLVVQTDEFLHTGLPLEFVDAVTRVDERLMSCAPGGSELSVDRCRALGDLLEEWRAAA